MCKKLYPIAVRFSFEECEEIKRLAAGEGISVSSYIRGKIALESSHKNPRCQNCGRLSTALTLLLIKNTDDDNQLGFRLSADDRVKLKGYLTEILHHFSKFEYPVNAI